MVKAAVKVQDAVREVVEDKVLEVARVAVAWEELAEVSDLAENVFVQAVVQLFHISKEHLALIKSAQNVVIR